MIKGYIFKNDEGRWELGFLSHIDGDDALYTTFDTYSTHNEALKALIKRQIEGQ